MEHSIEDVLGRKMVFKEDYDAVATERNELERQLAGCRERLAELYAWERDAVATINVVTEEEVEGGTMTKHTPGPWKVDGIANSSFFTDDEDEGMIGTCRHSYFSPATEVANARLIAAAPEMFDTLRWLVNLGHGVSKEGGKPTDNEWRDALDAGKAIIAKARGDQ